VTNWPVGTFGRVQKVTAAGFLALVVCGCGGQKPAQAPQKAVVHTVVATTGTIHPDEQLAGIVAPYQNVAIESTLTEPADTVNVQEGDLVRSGEVIAQLDTADLRAALAANLATAASDRASTSHTVYAGGLSIAQGVDTLKSAQNAVAQAQANLTRDQNDLNRYRQLVANGYVSQQQVDGQATTVRDDQQALGAALASLASAQSNVSANGTLTSNGLQAASVEQSRATEDVALAQAQEERVAISKATIVSPIDGVVVNRNLNVGEYPGTRQLFTLQQVEPIYAVLHGSGSQVASIATGGTATIASSDLRGARYKGQVVGVLNELTPGSTDFQVKILLHNPGGRLRPGMIVTANVSLPAASGIRIPITAFTDDNHDTVMVVAADGTVKTVNVSEETNDGTMSVVSGLAAGSRVVGDGQTSIGNGEKVAVQ
jgi:multidrug efflux pump subunit AcrA (membrane-fusion protein)